MALARFVNPKHTRKLSRTLNSTSLQITYIGHN